MPRLSLVLAPRHPRRPDGVSDARATVSFEVTPGTPVLDAAVARGIAIATLCGGAMHCRTCRVVVVAGKENLSRRGLRETEILIALGAHDDERLACQARVRGDVVVRVPPPQDMVR